jgi:glycosyltransferase involved in cell wall biosynthesis
MNEPNVSVVIPCFNGSAYLRDCVRSVLDQKTNCEIIVVDDGSTDDSLAVAESLMSSCSMPLLVVSQRNSGPAAARNAGLRLARAPYICFLDVDDEYLPGFFSAAIQILNTNADIAVVMCRMDIIGCDLAVEPWQKDETERTLPGNMILRTDAARTAGGFSEHPGYRGPAAGEDSAFRQVLLSCGRNIIIETPYYKYRVHPNSHFTRFLNRSRMVDGHIEFHDRSKEEQDGSMLRAFDEYRNAFNLRMMAKLLETLNVALMSTRNFYDLSQLHSTVDGFLHPYEGYVLYLMARRWPARGRVVEIGSFKGLSTCWLASGCKDGGRQSVAAVDHFQGSPEHQLGGTHVDQDIALRGSTLPMFQANIQRLQLGDHVTVHVGSSATIAPKWAEPIRLLFIDGDHTYEATRQDFELWSPYVVQHGLVLFHDVGVWPGVTQFFEDLLTHTQSWALRGRYHSLGIVEQVR